MTLVGLEINDLNFFDQKYDSVLSSWPFLSAVLHTSYANVVAADFINLKHRIVGLSVPRVTAQVKVSTFKAADFFSQPFTEWLRTPIKEGDHTEFLDAKALMDNLPMKVGDNMELLANAALLDPAHGYSEVFALVVGLVVDFNRLYALELQLRAKVLHALVTEWKVPQQLAVTEVGMEEVSTN